MDDLRREKGQGQRSFPRLTDPFYVVIVDITNIKGQPQDRAEEVRDCSGRHQAGGSGTSESHQDGGLEREGCEIQIVQDFG